MTGGKGREIAMDLLVSVAGSALVGMGLSVFTVPNDIAPGGVSGLATALAYITPIRVSVWTVALNVPLLIGAWRMLGRRSLLYTLLCTALLSLFIELSDQLLPAYTNNALLAAIYGGGIMGLGVGILFLRNISTGGTDLLALMLKKVLPNVNNGTLLLGVDTVVVLLAVVIFRDIDVALYSIVAIMASSRIIDLLAEGADYAKVIYVVTDRGEAVAEALNTQTSRGSTVIPAYGGYTGDGKQVIFTVTRRTVLTQTLRVIKQADPRAFTFVTDSTEVHGEGFKED